MGLIKVTNNLTKKQRQELSNKLEVLLMKYSKHAFTAQMRGRDDLYFEGVQEGINMAYKLINQIDDDYNSET